MRNYMARLGEFQFGIDTAAFTELKRSSAWRWEAKNRIGRAPAMQSTGRDADTITLSGVIYPHWRGGLGQMAALRALAGTGQPQPLVYAFENAGQYCGRWCVTSVEETRTVLFDNGQPRRIEFGLTLREYGDDGDTDGLLAPAAAALPAAAIDAPAVAAQATALADTAQTVTTQAGALDAMASVAATIGSVTSAISNGISAVMNSDAVRLAKTAVSTVNELQARARALENGARGLRAALGDVTKLPAALSNLGTAAGAASDTMSKASDGLTLAADRYRGAAPGTLHATQSKSAAGVLTQMADASASIQTTAAHLRILF